MLAIDVMINQLSRDSSQGRRSATALIPSHSGPGVPAGDHGGPRTDAPCGARGARHTRDSGARVKSGPATSPSMAGCEAATFQATTGAARLHDSH